MAGDIVCQKKFTLNYGTIRHAAIRLLPGSQVALGNGAVVAFDSVSVIGDMTLDGGQGLQVLQVTNGFICQTLRIEPGMQLWLQDEQTLAAGEYVLDGPCPSGGIILALPGSKTTLAPAVRISGLFGRIDKGAGTQTGVLTNEGVIAASAPSGQLIIRGEGFKNRGILRATGGTLRLPRQTWA